ncbi:MAG: MarR family transcriptional regulator [Bacteroidetes bacterium]|nr:MarR family transcriptional regulator [Bacteroidota bacterium]MBI3482483.1 MarR family transcriptional regulator [Bacteroidota bacterium]
MKIEEEIKQSKFKNPFQKVAINLQFTANWLAANNNDFFKNFGITMQQFNILRILRGQNPNSISAAEIKQRMLDRNSDVSRLLDRLIDKKLIVKTQCKEDKRATDVKITENGLKLLSKIDLRLEEIDSKFLNLTAKEANQLSDLLDKCRG